MEARCRLGIVGYTSKVTRGGKDNERDVREVSIVKEGLSSDEESEHVDDSQLPAYKRKSVKKGKDGKSKKSKSKDKMKESENGNVDEGPFGAEEDQVGDDRGDDRCDDQPQGSHVLDVVDSVKSEEASGMDLAVDFLQMAMSEEKEGEEVNDVNKRCLSLQNLIRHFLHL